MLGLQAFLQRLSGEFHSPISRQAFGKLVPILEKVYGTEDVARLSGGSNGVLVFSEKVLNHVAYYLTTKDYYAAHSEDLYRSIVFGGERVERE